LRSQCKGKLNRKSKYDGVKIGHDLWCFACAELVELIEFTRATFLHHVSKAKAAKLVRMLIDLFLDMEAGSGKEVRINPPVTEPAQRTFHLLSTLLQ